MVAILVTFFTALVGIAYAGTEKANPIGKAVELLDVLKAQLEEDMQKDGDAYSSFAAWATGEIRTAKRVIKETKAKIADLKSSIDEEKASREQMQADREETANELAQAEKELSEAKEVRAKERKEFETNDAVFVESIDQLDRALEVLAKKFKEQGGAGASLLSVATKLRNTLEQGADFQLTAQQRDILADLIHTAKARQAAPQQSLSPDFLQVRARSSDEPDDYGDYESKSSPIVDTLQKVREKTVKSRDEARAEEKKAADAFKKLETQLSKQIEVAKNRIDDLDQQIAQSQQRQSEMEADLKAAEDLLANTMEHKKDVEAEFQSKTRAYKARAVKRSDETVAVKEGIRVLTSETAKMMMGKQSIGTADFLQISQQSRRKALYVIHRATSPGLALLALRSHTRARAWSAYGDPFDKVKSMIKDMLDKLTEQSNKDAKHNAWCETEMGKTSESIEDKEMDYQKMSDRLDAMSNEIIKLTDELAQANQDLSDIRDALSASSKVRDTESTQYAKSLKEYQDGQMLLGHAIKALKQFYNENSNDDNASTEGSASVTGEKNREGLGAGIVAILEVAQQDFADMEKEARQAEKNSKGGVQEDVSGTRDQDSCFPKRC
jgi:chromosome segregation ATPase